MPFTSIADPPYGARSGRTESRVRSFAAGSVDAVLDSAGTFRDGDPVCVIGAGAPHGLEPPAAPTASIVGTPGSTLREYALVALTADFGWSAAGTVLSVSNAPDTLDDDHFVIVEPAPTDADIYQYIVYCRTGGASADWAIAGGAVIDSSITLAKAFVDRGWRPSGVPRHTLPVTELPMHPVNNLLRTRIVSGGGTTTLKLQDAAISAVERVRIDFDNTLPILDCMRSNRLVAMPAGLYRCWGNISIDRAVTLRGDDRDVTTIEFGPAFGMSVESAARDSDIGGFKIKAITTMLPAGRMLAPTPDKGGAPHTMYHGAGLSVKTECVLRDIIVQGMYGSGIIVRASRAEGTNANRAQLLQCRASSNYGHGIVTSGQDANICLILSGNSIGNHGDGCLDASFLGCTWVACHASANRGRAYAARNEGECFATFVGCYSEAGLQRPSVIKNPAVVLGGDHGAGFDRQQSTGLVIENKRRVTGLTINSGPQSARRDIELGEYGAHGNSLLFFSIDSGDFTHLKHRILYADLGRIQATWAGEAYGSAFWWWGGANYRAPGKLHFENFFGVGATSGEFRKIGFARNQPEAHGVYGIGDIYFDISGDDEFWRPSRDFGVGAEWAPNKVYRVGEVVYPRARNNSAYVCVRVNGSTLNTGRSDVSEPKWRSDGVDITDGGITWRRFGSDEPSWERRGRRARKLTIEVPSIGPHSVVEIPIEFDGADLGSAVLASPVMNASLAPLAPGFVWSAYISAINRVTIRVANVTAVPIDADEHEWNIVLFRN